MADQQRVLHGIGELGRLVQPFGWITSSTTNVVSYPQMPQANAPTQAQVDSFVGGMTIAHLFAVFEDALPHGGRGLPEWQDHHILPAEREELLAYRHVRHVVVHSMNGDRAGIHSHRVEFEAFHQAGRMPNIHWDATLDVIRVPFGSTWNQLLMWMQNLLQQVAARCGNPCTGLPSGQSCA